MTVLQGATTWIIISMMPRAFGGEIVATLHVRNVPDDLYARIRERAADERRSLSAEVIAILERQLPPKGAAREVLAEIDRLNELHPWPANLPDVVELLREDRSR